MMLLLHVLMLSLLSGGSTKVVEDFEQECGQFFANEKSPTQISEEQYKQICQTLDNVVHYATYYDTLNRIPVYSAYKFEGKKGSKRLKYTWFIEPQLDYENGGSNMGSVRSVPLNIRGSHQARYIDYTNSGYDRGHLAPVYHAGSQSCAKATFTLTNAAPQASRFNRVSWWNVEKTLATYLKRQCRPRHAYIVTGVVPGHNYIGYKGEDRVNVPSHFWTAFCCLDQNNRCSHSGGVIATNDNNSFIIGMTVEYLERKVLQNLYRKTFRIFQ